MNQLVTSRICVTCGVEKDINQFEHNHTRGGFLNSYRSKCKECRANDHRKLASTSEWRTKNRAWKKAQYAKRKLDPDAMLKFQFLQCRYKLTVAEYREMYDKQLGLCALCGGTNPSGKRLFVDHDHKTGTVRGLLCTSCNAAIGMLCDRIPDWQERVTEYLKKR